MITVTLMQPGADNTTIEIEDETTVESFLAEQDLSGTVYRNAEVANATDILNNGDRVLVVPDKSVKGA